MTKIKLIYIDKDRWEDEVSLFSERNELDDDYCHEFVYYNNVVSLGHDSKSRTICTLNNLITNIDRKITAKHNTIILTGFGINLEYIFLNLINIAKDKEIDIYILDKSKFSIRSNVSMKIDLNEYDTDTEFHSIKDILEKNLNDSLENAKKSKNPEHANDLGISLSEENNNFLTTLFTSLGLEDFLEEYEELDEYDNPDDEQKINNLLQALDESAEFQINDNQDTDFNLGIKVNNGVYEISDEDNIIRLSKPAARKLSKILEVLIND